MRLTRHNGRANKNGAYSTSHNDRSFDLSNSDHIDADRAKQNIYWDCFNGFRQLKPKQDELLAETFDDVEDIFYAQRYAGYVEGQHARNKKNRHPERDRTTTQIRKNEKTCPEESIYQLGTMEEHASAKELTIIVSEFLAEIDRRFGEHVHILNWSLHMDEATPHIHERHVFDCENRYGEIEPKQEKALEMLGFDLPDPTKKPGQYNNRKMTFDSVCRVLLFDICKKHGLHLIEEPEYGGRAYLEKQDFILQKQKAQIKENESTLETQEAEIETKTDQLEELTLKIDDIETLVDEVAEVAYDKAVEVVTDAAVAETHKSDLKVIRDLQKWVDSPECKASKKERSFASASMEKISGQIRKMMSATVQKVKAWLVRPDVKQAGKAEIKKETKRSVLEMLRRSKEQLDSDQQNQNQQKQKKQNIEL